MASSVEIVLTAKNKASAVFEKVGTDMKSAGENYKQATRALKQGSDAVSKALSGDLVGAAQSAVGAIKAMGAAMMANPWMAVVVAIGAAVTALIAFHNKQKEIAKELEELQKRNASASKSVKDILEGTNLDKVKAKVADLKADGATAALDAEVSRLKGEAEAAVQQAASQVEQWSKHAEEAAKNGNKPFQEKAESQRDLWLAELRERKSILDQYVDLEKWSAEEQMKAKEKAEKEAEEQHNKELKDAEEKAKAEAKAREDAEKEKARIEKEYAEKRAAIEKELEKEKERLQQLELAANLERLKKQADAEKKLLEDSKNATQQAESTFAQSGLSGLKARREEARKMREEERRERDIQRQIERWNQGRRDSRAEAGHKIDEARKTQQTQQTNADNAIGALKEALDAQDQAKIQAINECRDKVAELSNALVGAGG